MQYGCADERLPDRSQVRRWVKAALETDVQATIRFVDAKEGRTLNRDFRGKDPSIEGMLKRRGIVGN